jgi:hypothetical protein
MIKGKQCTIIWHVDDLKISHVDPDVIKEIIKKISDKQTNSRINRLTPYCLTGFKLAPNSPGLD